MKRALNAGKPVEFDPKQKSPHWGKRKLAEDAFDLWWEWVQKPHESFLMIDADIHNPIMQPSPEDRLDRAKVNEAVRRFRESRKCST
jgi:hypothetical protein